MPARWVSVCNRQWTTAITAVWSESLWALRMTVLATNVEENDRAMAADGTSKALVSPSPRWVSPQLLCGCVTAWWRSRWCSQNLCRPFLRAVRFDYLFRLFTRHNFLYTRSVIIFCCSFFSFSWFNAKIGSIPVKCGSNNYITIIFSLR